MVKRKYQPDERLKAFAEQSKELYDAPSHEDDRDLAGLAMLPLFKLKATHPSFSAAEWETVAPSLSLRPDLGVDQLDLFTVPVAFLLPSFHRELMKNASRWMDVYQEPLAQVREESRVRLLEAVRIPNSLQVHL
jgi:hypothetical protein